MKEIVNIVIPKPRIKKRWGKLRLRGSVRLVCARAYLPEALNKKLDAYVANLNATSERKISKREVIMIAVALLIKGENHLAEYYKNSDIPIPKNMKKSIVARKNALNASIDDAIDKAVIRTTKDIDNFEKDIIG